VLATRKGARREVGSEGSVVQNRGSTNRNRISGSPWRTSGPHTAKSRSSKAMVCKSGEAAVKVVELTSGDLRRVSKSGLRGSRGLLTAAQKSAEGKVAPARAGRRPERSPQGVEGNGA
jgi:hypothetical protein